MTQFKIVFHLFILLSHAELILIPHQVQSSAQHRVIRSRYIVKKASVSHGGCYDYSRK